MIHPVMYASFWRNKSDDYNGRQCRRRRRRTQNLGSIRFLCVVAVFRSPSLESLRRAAAAAVRQISPIMQPET